MLFNFRFVGWTLVYADGLIVFEENALANVFIRQIILGISEYPGSLETDGAILRSPFVGWHHVFVIVSVHSPSQLKLLQIGNTFDGERLTLGLAQGR